MEQQFCTPSVVQILSVRQQEALKRKWNKKNADPLAYTPSEEIKRGIGTEEATVENAKLASFAVGYFKRALEMSGVSEEKTDVFDRVKQNKAIVFCGYGRRYDSDVVREAMLLGYQAWIIDVSDVSAGWAAQDVREFVRELGNRNFQLPQVKPVEICSVFADPNSIKLDLAKVEWWYMCRFLGCLSDRAASIACREVGHSLSEELDPAKKNGIVIINAFHNENIDFPGETSRLRKRKTVLKRIAKGAGRLVKPVYHETYQYFAKTVSAMTVKAA